MSTTAAVNGPPPASAADGPASAKMTSKLIYVERKPYQGADMLTDKLQDSDKEIFEAMLKVGWFASHP